jgi:hypothetical protein
MELETACMIQRRLEEMGNDDSDRSGSEWESSECKDDDLDLHHFL